MTGPATLVSRITGLLRDLFYAVLLVFVALRGAVPSLLPALAVLVATGSQCYWLACLAHLRRAHGAEAGRAGHPA